MTVRIGTSELDGTFYSQGMALRRLMEGQAAPLAVEVLESKSASIDNANRLHVGAIELGFMASNWIGRARDAKPPFTHPIELRMAAPMNAGPLFFIARADSDLRTVTDLRGRRLVVGPQQSGMAQHARVILGALGLTFADVTPIFLDFAAGAEALAHGEADAQLQCPIPNKVMTALAAQVLLRVLPYAPADLDTVLRVVPFYRRTVMRKGAIRSLDADVAQAAVVNVLVTHARTPENIVGEVAAAVFSARKELPRLNALFDGAAALFEPLRSDGAAALEFGGVALHSGAIAAYRAAGLLK